MKKMLLLLVSGLLLVCMAGSAMAAAPKIFDETCKIDYSSQTVELKPGQTLDLSYYVSYGPDDVGAYDYGIDVYATNGGSNTDITVLRMPATFTLVSGSNEFWDKDVITLLLDENAPAGAKYTISIGDLETPVVISATTVVSSVPEFPTVALPVAALIGLVFIFGRRKEGL
jgi:hypothetical protein